jgi:hypothetical protein
MRIYREAEGKWSNLLGLRPRQLHGCSCILSLDRGGILLASVDEVIE